MVTSACSAFGCVTLLVHGWWGQDHLYVFISVYIFCYSFLLLCGMPVHTPEGRWVTCCLCWCVNPNVLSACLLGFLKVHSWSVPLLPWLHQVSACISIFSLVCMEAAEICMMGNLSKGVSFFQTGILWTPSVWGRLLGLLNVTEGQIRKPGKGMFSCRFLRGFPTLLKHHRFRMEYRLRIL